VVKLLKDLNPNKASDPDGVSARLLKECAEVIADALVFLFNTSLKQGTIPNEWKNATITGNKN